MSKVICVFAQHPTLEKLNREADEKIRALVDEMQAKSEAAKKSSGVGLKVSS